MNTIDAILRSDLVSILILSCSIMYDFSCTAIMHNSAIQTYVCESQKLSQEEVPRITTQGFTFNLNTDKVDSE